MKKRYSRFSLLFVFVFSRSSCIFLRLSSILFTDTASLAVATSKFTTAMIANTSKGNPHTMVTKNPVLLK